MDVPSWIDDALLLKAHALVQRAHMNVDVANDVVKDAIAAFSTRTRRSRKSILQQLTGGHAPMRPIPTGALLLQRLILEKSDESAQRDGAQEVCAQSEETLLARYVHCIVLRALQATSRWAAVGMCQLIYGYRGSQVDEMISCVIRREQEWDERNRKDAKKKLMEYLSNRFPGFGSLQSRTALMYISNRPVIKILFNSTRTKFYLHWCHGIRRNTC